MKIDKNIGLKHSCFSSIPSHAVLDIVGTGNMFPANSTCALNGVNIDTTNYRGITLIVFTSTMTVSRIYRYDTAVNPHAFEANGYPSLADALRAVPLDGSFALYTQQLNTLPSRYDVIGNASADNIPAGRFHISDVFKNMRASVWPTIRRVENNNQEYRPYACFGIGAKSDNNFPTITHESSGSTRADTNSPTAALKVSIPNSALVNKVSRELLSEPVLSAQTIKYQFQFSGHSGYGIKVSLGANIIRVGVPSTQQLRVRVVRESNSVVIFEKILKNTIYTTHDFEFKPPAAGNYSLEITAQNGAVPYVQFAVAYETFLGSNDKIGVNKHMVFGRKIVASNIGVDPIDPFQIANALNARELWPSTSNKFIGTSSAEVIDIAANETKTSSQMSLNRNINHVIHMIASGVQCTLDVKTFDVDGNAIAGVKNLNGNFANSISLVYPASHSTIQENHSNTTQYTSHKLINIPLYWSDTVASKATFLGIEKESIPTGQSKPILYMLPTVDKIVVTVTAGTATYVFARLMQMNVGFNSTGEIYSGFGNG